MIYTAGKHKYNEIINNTPRHECKSIHWKVYDTYMYISGVLFLNVNRLWVIILYITILQNKETDK